MFDCCQLRQTVRSVYGIWHQANLSISTFCMTSALARADDVANMEFTALVQYLRDPAVIKSFKDMFLQVYGSALAKGTVFPEQTHTMNIRVFLAAHMCAFFPANTFETMGFAETTLFGAAKQMHKHFSYFVEHWMLCWTFEDLPVDMCNALVKSVHDYISAFNAWHLPDHAVVVTRTRNAVFGLLRSLQTSGPATFERRRGEILRLMECLAGLITPEQRAAFVQEIVQSGLLNPDTL
jgi:hypothetical protein